MAKGRIQDLTSGGLPSRLSRLKPTGPRFQAARDFQIMHNFD